MLTTSSGKAPAKPYRPAAGNLKRDINLLPANESSERAARAGTIALGILLGLVVLYFLAVFWPQTVLNGLKSVAGNAENQVALKSGVNKEFNDLAAQRNALQGMVDSLSQSGKGYPEPADLLDDLNGTCPDSITLTHITEDASGITLQGDAADDDAVAQFIVNLSTIPTFDKVALASVEENKDDAKSAKPRAFEIKCLLPEAQASPSPQPAPTQASEGGAGK